MEETTLRVKDNTGKTVFESDKHWLFPLLELENWLSDSANAVSGLILEDKIAGRAAAALAVRLGFKRVYIHTVSENALSYYSRYGVEVSFDEKVERILCKTEEITSDLMSPDEIYAIILKRIQ